MERDIRKELLDAIAVFQPTPAQVAVVEGHERMLYDNRCRAWQQRWNAAIGVIVACEATGNRHYQIETLGYLVWLLHKRPMRGGKIGDLFSPEGEL